MGIPAEARTCPNCGAPIRRSHRGEPPAECPNCHFPFKDAPGTPQDPAGEEPRPSDPGPVVIPFPTPAPQAPPRAPPKVPIDEPAPPAPTDGTASTPNDREQEPAPAPGAPAPVEVPPVAASPRPEPIPVPEAPAPAPEPPPVVTRADPVPSSPPAPGDIERAPIPERAPAPPSAPQPPPAERARIWMGMHLERLWLAVIAAFLAFCLGYLLAPTFPHYGLLLATAAFIMGLWAKTTRVAVRAFVPFPLLAIAGIHIVWWPVGALAALAGAVAAPGRTPARRWIWAALDAVAFSGGLFLLATWLGETTRAIVTWGVLAAALLLIGHSVESD